MGYHPFLMKDAEAIVELVLIKKLEGGVGEGHIKKICIQTFKVTMAGEDIITQEMSREK